MSGGLRDQVARELYEAAVEELEAGRCAAAGVLAATGLSVLGVESGEATVLLRAVAGGMEPSCEAVSHLLTELGEKLGTRVEGGEGGLGAGVLAPLLLGLALALVLLVFSGVVGGFLGAVMLPVSALLGLVGVDILVNRGSAREG